MPIIVNYNSSITTIETLAAGAGENAPVTHRALDTQITLNATTVPPVAETAFCTVALSSGMGSLDLTNCPTTNNAVVNGTGLKVQVFKFIAPSGNLGSMLVTPGMSNGYNFLGASAHIILNPGEELTFKGVNSASYPTIGSSAKYLTFTGTGNDTLLVGLEMG